ncbi:MAG: 4'-phosphopantetheinyl transferase superfamily protein, partial [Arenicellales bacterium]
MSSEHDTWDVLIPDTLETLDDGFHIFHFRFSPRLRTSDADHGNLVETERHRAVQFHHQIDRNRFTVGRSLLRQVLGRALGMEPLEIPLCIEKGRPFLDLELGDRWQFNISHSGECVMLILSQQHQVGIDVEVYRDFPDMDQVAKRVMTDEEFDSYRQLAKAHRIDAFYRLWVRKESILKYLGTGFEIEPRRLSVGHMKNNITEASFEGQR